jgi:ssDNA-binding Zn-finger/Zn-ribbon topoisomerase 1
MPWPTYINRHLLLTRRERREIHREAWTGWAKNRWNIVLYLFLPMAYLVGLTTARDAAGMIGAWFGASGLSFKIVRTLGLLLYAALCFFVGGAIFQRYRFAPLVYRALRRHGYDVCPKCGYWLKGLEAETRCPECGARRQPLPRARTEDPAAL